VQYDLVANEILDQQCICLFYVITKVFMSRYVGLIQTRAEDVARQICNLHHVQEFFAVDIMVQKRETTLTG